MSSCWTIASRHLMVSCLVFGAAEAAADAGTVAPGLEACLAAALKERPGFVHAWKEVSGGSQSQYAVSIVNGEGKIADATCSTSKPENFKFEERIGIRRVESYSRIKVPELSARGTAPQLFAGPVKVVRMEIDFDWRGRPAYEYRLVLPTGREAVAQVDTVSGMLLHAEILPE